MQVGGYMSRQPVTISPQDTLAEAEEKMRGRGCRRLPVVEAGVLTGIISDRDLGPHRGHLAETRVTAAMTENPITVTSTSPMRDAVLCMLEHKIDSLPVVDDGKLVGIVTTSDVLKAFVEGTVKAFPG
jgi:acetoin utilization protein AcuB